MENRERGNGQGRRTPDSNAPRGFDPNRRAFTGADDTFENLAGPPLGAPIGPRGFQPHQCRRQAVRQHPPQRGTGPAPGDAPRGHTHLNIPHPHGRGRGFGAQLGRVRPTHAGLRGGVGNFWDGRVVAGQRDTDHTVPTIQPDDTQANESAPPSAGETNFLIIQRQGPVLHQRVLDTFNAGSRVVQPADSYVATGNATGDIAPIAVDNADNLAISSTGLHIVHAATGPSSNVPNAIPFSPDGQVTQEVGVGRPPALYLGADHARARDGRGEGYRATPAGTDYIFLLRDGGQEGLISAVASMLETREDRARQCHAIRRSNIDLEDNIRDYKLQLGQMCDELEEVTHGSTSTGKRLDAVESQLQQAASGAQPAGLSDFETTQQDGKDTDCSMGN